MPAQGAGFIGQHTLAREALRQALGTEAGAADWVRYSKFSWFVWSTVISPPKEQPPEDGDDATPPMPERVATDMPRFRLLRPELQRKGMFYVTGNIGLLLSLVRAAEHGADRDALVAQVVEEAPTLNESSGRNVLAQAGNLGLLTLDNGTYRPTQAGRALLDGTDPAEVLVPAMVRGVYGFAHLLHGLRHAGGALAVSDVVSQLRAAHPAWTTDRMPVTLLGWVEKLGLTTTTFDAKGTRRAALTEDGDRWASGLPERIPLLRPDPGLELTAPTAGVSDSALATAPASPVAGPPAIEAVLDRLRSSPEASRFIVPERQVRLLHAALHASPEKRFALLSGLSGTGKTWLARAYARAYCAALGCDPAAHFTEVAVWPDWTDPSGLLGYANPLAEKPTFQRTPTLELLLAADRDRERPYFLCLDEMNLARVEHYFAPFLSAMEGAGRLALHAGGDVVDGVPAAIAWPTNLFVFGTVNMDETTHPFSDKVLDRAFTFEFWDVDLKAWAEKAKSGFGAPVLEDVLPVLHSLQAALRPGDHAEFWGLRGQGRLRAHGIRMGRWRN